MPRTKKRVRTKKKVREFLCETCEPRSKDNQDCRWFEKVSVKRPYDVCKGCDEEKAAVEVEKGELVGSGFFHCQCDNEYTVRCRGIDTAKCYKCQRYNHPTRVTRLIYWNRKKKKKTNNKHSCSRCSQGGNGCPNLRAGRSRRS